MFISFSYDTINYVVNRFPFLFLNFLLLQHNDTQAIAMKTNLQKAQRMTRPNT